VCFRDPSYVGDPVNAVRVFNEKEVDELVILDIDASKHGEPPNFELLADIASEAFMPMGYGGGIRSLDDARRIFAIGFEKIVVNSLLFDDPRAVRMIVEEYGSSGVDASIDVVSGKAGAYNVYDHRTGRHLPVPLAGHLAAALSSGVGEVLLAAVDRDGTLKGYDIPLIRQVAGKLNVPLVVSGGAGKESDFRAAIEAGASAAAAGAMFVYYGPHRAVLIQYPEEKTLDALFA
jgi:cyclase